MPNRSQKKGRIAIALPGLPAHSLRPRPAPPPFPCPPCAPTDVVAEPVHSGNNSNYGDAVGEMYTSRYYIYIYMYVYEYKDPLGCTLYVLSMHIYIYMYVNMYICTYIFAYTYLCTNTFICLCINIQLYRIRVRPYVHLSI